MVGESKLLTVSGTVLGVDLVGVAGDNRSSDGLAGRSELKRRDPMSTIDPQDQPGV